MPRPWVPNRAVAPEQWLQRHPEAGSSCPSWPKASQAGLAEAPRSPGVCPEALGPEALQGYLAHKKCFPLGPYSRNMPGFLGGWAFSYERGAPVGCPRWACAKSGGAPVAGLEAVLSRDGPRSRP